MDAVEPGNVNDVITENLENTRVESLSECCDILVYDSIKLWCHDCQTAYLDACPKHGEFKIIPDSRALKSHYSLPNCLELKPDLVKTDLFTVCAKVVISKGIRFGPLDGPSSDAIDQNCIDQTWMIFKNMENVEYIKMDDPKLCNWMMYVQRASKPSQQNLVAFQHKEHIYFVTTTRILEGDPLYYDYSRPYLESFVHKLSINDKKHSLNTSSTPKKKPFDSIDTRLAYESTSDTEVLHVCVVKERSDDDNGNELMLDTDIPIKSAANECANKTLSPGNGLDFKDTEIRNNPAIFDEDPLINLTDKRKLAKKRKKKIPKKPSWLKANIAMDEIMAHRQQDSEKETKKTETVGTIAMIENTIGQNSIMIIHPLVLNESHQKPMNLPKLSVPSIVNSAIMRAQESSCSLVAKTENIIAPQTKKMDNEDTSPSLVSQTTVNVDSCDSLSFSYPSLSQSTENIMSSACDADYDFSTTPVGYTPRDCASTNVITGDIGINLNSSVANKSHSDSENFIDSSDIVRASMLQSRITTPTKSDDSLNIQSTVTNERGSSFGSPQTDSFVKNQISADDLLNQSSSEVNNHSLLSTAPSLMEVYKSLSEFIDVSEVNNAVVEVYDPNTSFNDSKMLGSGPALSQNELGPLNSFDNHNFNSNIDMNSMNDLNKKSFDDDHNLTFSPMKKANETDDNSYRAYICDTLTCSMDGKKDLATGALQNCAESEVNNQGKITMIPVKINTQNMPVNTIFKKNWQTYYVCATCGKSFEMQCRLKRHLRSHQLAGDYLCDLCGKNFKHKSGYERHLRTHDEGREENKFFCGVCKKGFVERYHCRRHEVRHTGNHFVHKCVVCNKMFSSKHHLKRHNLIHEGIRPYSCPRCGRQFTQKGDMLKHFRTHPKEKEID